MTTFVSFDRKKLAFVPVLECQLTKKYNACEKSIICYYNCSEVYMNQTGWQ